MPPLPAAPDLLLSPRRRRWLLAAGTGTAAALGTLAWRGRASPAPALAAQGEAMGSTWQLRLAGAGLDAAAVATARQAVAEALAGVERRMSTFLAESDIGRFNRTAGTQPVALAADTLDVLAAGQRIAAATGGAFDMTVAPLVGAWGFGAGASARGGVPAAAELAQPVGWRGLVVDPTGGQARRVEGGLRLDLSGIAKGHAVDQAAAALDRLGLGRYMVEAGGEVRTRGRNAAGRPWQIAVEEPDAWPPRPRRVIGLDGLAMATSGDYRNWWALGDRRIHHEIDPRTRAPAAHRLASVTVVHARCREADALATALFVLGPDAGLAFARAQGLAALFVLRTPDGGLRDLASPAFDALG